MAHADEDLFMSIWWFVPLHRPFVLRADRLRAFSGHEFQICLLRQYLARAQSGTERSSETECRSCFPSPLVGEGGSTTRSAGQTGEGFASADRDPSSAFALAKAPSPTRGEG